MRACHFVFVGLAAAAALSVGGEARAVMGAPTIMSRVDTDGDHTLSLAEVRSAAGKRYDLIKAKNHGRVTMLQLGGRVTSADAKTVGLAAGTGTEVSKDNYLTLATKFFDEADIKRKPGEAPGSGTLDDDELGSPAGKKLVGLLQ